MSDPKARKPWKKRLQRVLTPHPCKLCGKLTIKAPAKGRYPERGRKPVFCSSLHQGAYWSLGHPPQKTWNMEALAKGVAKFRARRRAELEAEVEAERAGRPKNRGGVAPSRPANAPEHFFVEGEPVEVFISDWNEWRPAEFKGRNSGSDAPDDWWYEVRYHYEPPLRGVDVIAVWPGQIRPVQVEADQP